MKKLFYIIMCLILPHCLMAQGENKAKEILDKTFTNFVKGGGIQIEFRGTNNGSIIMKGEKFYLHSENVQCWYDGHTQWSYVEEVEEVNISNPTPEELQSINPYYILSNYKENYNYSYSGQKALNKKMVHEIILTPKVNNEKDRIILWFAEFDYPIYMIVEQNGNTVSEFHVKSFEKQKQINDHVFQFNKSLYPNAEIIDLR